MEECSKSEIVMIGTLKFDAKLCNINQFRGEPMIEWGVRLQYIGFVGESGECLLTNPDMKATPQHVEKFIEECCGRKKGVKSENSKNLEVLRFAGGVFALKSVDAADRFDKDRLFQKVLGFLEEVDGKLHQKPDVSRIKNPLLPSLDGKCGNWRGLGTSFGRSHSVKNDGWDKF